MSCCSSAPRVIAWNTSPATQALPMMRPSRSSRSRDFGIRGRDLKYFKWLSEMSR